MNKELATIEFWKHEMLMHQQARKYRIMLAGSAAIVAGLVLLLIL